MNREKIEIILVLIILALAALILDEQIFHIISSIPSLFFR
jgi:hypothetical protein